MLYACESNEDKDAGTTVGANPESSVGGDNETSNVGKSDDALEIKLLAVNNELWRTDGTDVGTVLVAPINNTSAKAVSFPYGFTEFNGALYFQAYDSVNGFELWKTEGTTAGITLVKDINTAAGASSFHYRFADFTVFNAALYFQANDGVNGYELWKTDGTAVGTVLVKDINTTTGASSSPSDFTVFNGSLYFSASNSLNSRKLWKTDGTAAGTVLVKDITIATGTSFLPDDFSRGFPVFNGAIYFITLDSLWKTDDSAVGPMRVEDINTTTGWWISHLYNGFIVFNGALYFPADDGVNGKELWKTDGTAAGTALVKDINTQNGGRRSDEYFTAFTELNGTLYFYAKDNVNGPRLWKTDGTDAGTILVKNTGIGYPPFDFTLFNNSLYFRTGDGLWKTDGTAVGTIRVKNIKT